ncbi:MAG: glutamate--tRNA ligase [Acidobacteria bacterium]|uniref:Glutamate--tRNA ligase n=1 Tax=Candidatus Polarisedimenticola svalbardensis TaxID=2886004 RepID=A0A8J6Y1G6_9BACT|nr:glutamate--tRNA ligase [Candidatus Polarisedimenticola svalbardensis]
MNAQSQIRVRFAPSPTGHLHVGGARSALFNWLYARNRSGVFVLRIEDTDRERSSEAMVQGILDGMDWLGIEPDEGPFFQSREQKRHAEDAARLLEDGKAYRCYCTTEELQEHRERMSGSGKPGPTCPGGCRSLVMVDDGRPFALRFAVPPGEISWDDLVHGETSFDGDSLEDFIILRSDGTPTYMLSVVSDDAAQRITDVIRGDDHISNTPKQILLYQALGYPVPRFGHMPLILGEDKKRLSKRHGAVSVLQYRDEGFLPGAMFNFLALLGWSPGDDRQQIDSKTLVQEFSLDGIGKAGAVFDRAKLEWLNGLYINELSSHDLEEAVRPGLQAAGLWSDDLRTERKEWFRKLLLLLQPRCRTLQDFPAQAARMLDGCDDFEYEEKAARKHLKGDLLRDNMVELTGRLEIVPNWRQVELEALFRTLAEERDVSAGKLIHPVRLAVTGSGSSPGLFEVLELLGRDRTLARLERLVEFLTKRPAPL